MLKLLNEVIFIQILLYVAHHVENGFTDEFVDEKGTHDDIYKFASSADIVVCCLIMNKDTVRLCFPPIFMFLFFFFLGGGFFFWR